MENQTLLAETLGVLDKQRKSPGDVRFVSHWRGGMTWSQFERAARNIVYDGGFGTNYISLDLKIVGDDWWLERHEYDGSEWWEFKTMPEAPTEYMQEDAVKTCILECA